MKILSDTEIEGGYAVVDLSDPKGGCWIYYFFVINFVENKDFIIRYYNSNEFGKRGGYVFLKNNAWDNFDDWYFEQFDTIYEFTFYNAEDAMAFKLRWL